MYLRTQTNLSCFIFVSKNLDGSILINRISIYIYIYIIKKMISSSFSNGLASPPRRGCLPESSWPLWCPRGPCSCLRRRLDLITTFFQDPSFSQMARERSRKKRGTYIQVHENHGLKAKKRVVSCHVSFKFSGLPKHFDVKLCSWSAGVEYTFVNPPCLDWGGTPGGSWSA